MRTRLHAPLAPALGVRMNPSIGLLGANQHIVISFVGHALVQARITFPRQGSIVLVDMSDSHGRVTFTVRVPRRLPLFRGRTQANVIVRAMVGRFQRIASLAPVIHPGSIRRLVVAARPGIPVRVTMTLGRRRLYTMYDSVDSGGRLVLAVRAPGQRRSVTVQVVVSTIVGRASQVTRMLTISNETTHRIALTYPAG